MLLGAIFLRGTTPGDHYSTGCFAANFVHPGMTTAQAFLCEIVLTAWLLLVICAATDSFKSNQTLVPLAIGLCITCCHLMSMPITGTSLNPTRSFASAAVASDVPGCAFVWDDMWVWFAGPMIGGVAGSFMYDYCFQEGGQKFLDLMSMYRSKSGFFE